MDYLPELAHNGHNWTTYASSVLCAITAEGLMGFLVGSETRPIHPAELEGCSEGWTPQTNDERDAVTAWRTADQLWTQRNTTVNYTIICGIPDTIFGLMLHLKSPHEKWDYLEKRFGSIPRPESWLAAEEAMRQWETQPEQSAAGETIQSTCDSHDDPENLTGSQENTSDSPNNRTEILTGYLEPEMEIVDVQQTEGSSLVDEAGATGATWPDESMNTSKVPDDEVMASQDLPGLSSKALEPEGNNLLDTTSERAETKTGHTKPEPDVVDARQVVDILSMFEDGIADQEWLDKHSNTLEAPDERSQCTADKVVERRDSPEWSPEACKPAGDTAKRTRKCSIGFAPKTYLGQDQSLPTSGETILNVPGPPPLDAEIECPIPQDNPPARMCSTTTTAFNLSHARRHDKQRETKCLEHDSKQSSRRSQQTVRGHPTQDTPPDKVWGVGVHRLARTGKGDSTDVKPTTTKLEIRATSAQTVDMQADLPHAGRRPKEPDKAEGTSGGGDDKPSSEFSDSHGVRKPMLAGSGSQRTEQEVKRSNGLPVPPETHENGFIHLPRTLADPCRRSRIKADLRNICSIETRGYRCLALNVPTSLPHEVSKRLWNIADTCQRQDMPHRRTRNHRGPSDSRTAVSRQRHETTRQDGEHAWLKRLGTPAIPLVLPWKWTGWNNKENSDATSSNAVCSHGAEKELLADSRSQHTRHEAKRQDGLPAPPELPPTGIPHAPQLYRMPH